MTTIESAPSTEQLERNLRWYAVYVAASNALFWMPLFFLYFSQHLDVAQVLRLEAVYYAAVVLLEVPTGVASDRRGAPTAGYAPPA